MNHCSTQRYRQKREGSKVAWWNDNYPVGQKVKVTFLPESGIKDKKIIETATCSKATLFLGMAVLRVENFDGWILLSQIEPQEE